LLKTLPALLLLLAALACSGFGVGGFGANEPVPDVPTPRPWPTATATPTADQCDPSYPTVCIHHPPLDLDCADIKHKNFQVVSPDPHVFDPDKNGVGCESMSTREPTHPADGDCDPSYPAICVPRPPPDLDCDDIEERNFKVVRPDKHYFDLDGDGVGCEE